MLVNPTNSNAQITLRRVEAAARAMALQIQVLKSSTSCEINAAFAAIARARPDAIYVGISPFLSSSPCLASLRSKVRTARGYVHELKLDG